MSSELKSNTLANMTSLHTNMNTPPVPIAGPSNTFTPAQAVSKQPVIVIELGQIVNTDGRKVIVRPQEALAKNPGYVVASLKLSEKSPPLPNTEPVKSAPKMLGIKPLGANTVLIKDGKLIVQGPDHAAASAIASQLSTGEARLGNVGGNQVLLVMEPEGQASAPPEPAKQTLSLVRTPKGVDILPFWAKPYVMHKQFKMPTIQSSISKQLSTTGQAALRMEDGTQVVNREASDKQATASEPLKDSNSSTSDLLPPPIVSTPTSSAMMSEVFNLKRKIEAMESTIMSKLASLEKPTKRKMVTIPSCPECPICFDEMKPPTKIAQCLSGHLICLHCKERPEVSSCPICKQRFTGERAIGMESFLRDLLTDQGQG